MINFPLLACTACSTEPGVICERGAHCQQRRVQCGVGNPQTSDLMRLFANVIARKCQASRGWVFNCCPSWPPAPRRMQRQCHLPRALAALPPRKQLVEGTAAAAVTSCLRGSATVASTPIQCARCGDV